MTGHFAIRFTTGMRASRSIRIESRGAPVTNLAGNHVNRERVIMRYTFERCGLGRREAALWIRANL